MTIDHILDLLNLTKLSRTDCWIYCHPVRQELFFVFGSELGGGKRLRGSHSNPRKRRRIVEPVTELQLPTAKKSRPRPSVAALLLILFNNIL
jgi:hypothetical protein